VRGLGWTSEALLALDAAVDGPVHPPFSAEAAVELALAAPLPVRTHRRVVAVVGATGTADVARVLAWAAEHDAEVVTLGVRAGHGVRCGDRPVVALSLTRADRVVAAPVPGIVRAGVGAAWSAVGRAATEVVRRPSTAFDRPGIVAGALGATTLRGATVVTGDGVVHTLPGPGCATELWWALRTRPGAVGVVTAVVLDARYTTVVLPHGRSGDGELVRLVHLARRHDPAGLLGVPDRG
jgi:hypothetical protein